jgi:hypothetical protein
LFPFYYHPTTGHKNQEVKRMKWAENKKTDRDVSKRGVLESKNDNYLETKFESQNDNWVQIEFLRVLY